MRIVLTVPPPPPPPQYISGSSEAQFINFNIINV